jgi:hypothetical protein
MKCHECARAGRQTAAVSGCRFCMVGLCKDHLVASFQGATVPQYGCEDHPERAFPARSLEGNRPIVTIAA